MSRSSPFIVPSQPTLRNRPPKGEHWLHEVKFDGYRVQIHKAGKDVTIYSRSGANFTARWPAIVYALQGVPAKSAIIDAEVVANNAKGVPDIDALHCRRAKPEDFMAWAFDLLELNGVDIRQQQLLTRRAKLQTLIALPGRPMSRSDAIRVAHRPLGFGQAFRRNATVSVRSPRPWPWRRAVQVARMGSRE